MSSARRLAPAAAMLAVLFLTPAALADHDVFLGWSRDNSYAVKVGQHRQKDRSLYFCSDDPKPSWPKEVGNRERRAGCVRFEVGNSEITVAQAKELVKAHPSRKGPKGETITLGFKDAGDGISSHVVATLRAGNRKIEIDTGYSVGNEPQKPTTRLTDVFWRPDGKQVAVYIDTNPANPNAERWTFVWNYAKDLEVRPKEAQAK